MKAILFANTEWYLYNFRCSLALALRDAGHEVVLISPPGPYGERLRELGLRWEALPMDRRSLNPLREVALLWHLWRLFRRERPALVHGFTIKCAVYGSIAARLARIPARVSAVAGMGYVFTNADAKARLLRPLVRAMLQLALGGKGARLILQNQDDVALFRQAQLVAPERVRLIAGSGVDCIRFHPPQDAREVRPLRVLMPARLLWDKGVGEFVEAARRVRASGRNIVFLVAGDPDPGNPAAVSASTVRKWTDEGVIEWLGHVDDMPTLFRSVQIVALPSYREGLSKGLIEAAASGCALVTTDVPGCREVVGDDGGGLLVPARDPVSLADAIILLDDDPELLRRLRARARARALAAFDEKLVIARTLAVYSELLGESR